MSAVSVSVDLAPGAAVPPPLTGLRLGSTREGPVVLRLFRQDGTRLAVLGGAASAQLLTLRAAAAGIPVGVVTGRPTMWGPLASQGSDFRVEPSVETVADAIFLIDDTHAMDVGGVAPAAPWQCRVELRTPWTPNDLIGLTSADAVIVGQVTPDIASGVRSAFGISRGEAGTLTTLDPASVGILHHGAIRFLSLDPTAAEIALLGRAR